MTSSRSEQIASLFNAHRSELQAFAFRRLRDREAAADVVQDAFVRYAAMIRESAAPDRVEQPLFFLWRILANLMTDRERQIARRGLHYSLDEVAESIPDSQPSAERTADAQQRLLQLRAALVDFPPNCRDALLMNRIDGLSHAEIAARLGVSASMVSKYIMQALRHCARATNADPLT